MSTAEFGFTYTLETIKDGVVVDREVVHNLIPIEGLNHIIAVALKNGTQYANWYVGLFSGDYAPVPLDTMATFPGSATEIVAYTGTTRPVLTLGTPVSGQADNLDSRAEFTGTTDGTIALGGFISSSPTKGATTGVLISAAQFPSPKTLDDGSVLRVTCLFTTVSL